MEGATINKKYDHCFDIEYVYTQKRDLWRGAQAKTGITTHCFNHEPSFIELVNRADANAFAEWPDRSRVGVVRYEKLPASIYRSEQTKEF